MSIFTDITCSGAVVANTLTGGVQARGLVPVAGEPAVAPLAASGNTDNLELPQLGFQGAMFWPLTTAGAGAVLTGIASAEAQPGMIIILKNANALGGNNFATSANGGSSTAGNRFSIAVTLHPGQCAQFLYDGTFWCPFVPA